MGYTVSITKSGQMTLPKELRQFLRLDGARKVTLEKEKDRVVLKRKMSKDEFFAKLDTHVSEEAREIARKDGDKSVSRIIDEYHDSPAGRKEMEDKYGRLA